MGLTGEDETLVCSDCGRPFAFTTGEQAFYQERGFGKPTRCAECRAQRRAERNAEVIAGYDAAGAAGPWRDVAGYGGYGGTAGGSSRDPGTRPRPGGFGPRQLHAAVCAECGRETQVPFQPRGDRPVYCRDCFNRRQGR